MKSKNISVPGLVLWKGAYLKWICGFANAQGGVLVIGRNDAGEAAGVTHASKLLEDIPNKVRELNGKLWRILNYE